MAQFPRYESKGQLTSQAPSVGAAADTSPQMMEAAGKIGTQVQDLAVKWSNAVDVIQETTATANHKGTILQTQNDFVNNPNATLEDYNSALKSIDKSQETNLSQFTSQAAKSKASITLGYESQVAKIQIQNAYKKKMGDIGIAKDKELEDIEINNPTDSSMYNIKKSKNRLLQAGLIDHTTYVTGIERANKELGVNRISKDLFQSQTPEDIDSISQKITDGSYERGGVTIDPDKKKNLLEVADRARANLEKKIAAQQEDALVQNRVDTVSAIASGKVPIENIDMTEIATYDPILAGTLNKVKDFMVNYNPKKTVQEQGMATIPLLGMKNVQSKQYAKSILDVFMQNDNKDLSDFMLRELDKKKDGLTPSVKIAAFVNLAAMKAKANNPQTPQDSAMADRLDAINSGIKFLMSANPYVAPQAISDFVVKNFHSGASDRKAVMKEARSGLESIIIDRYKSVAKLPSMPNKIVDGEASVEDLHSGVNDLKEGSHGSYADDATDY